MALIESLRLGAVAASFAVLSLSSPVAGADPVKLAEGAAQLPTSGLIVDLPAQPGVEYHVSGSWATDKDGKTFDTRDVIDEIDVASGNVSAGNWVLSGYFTAGDCDAVLAAEKLDKPWTSSIQLWGESWSVRGGVYTFENSLGRRPTGILCRTLESGASILLYRFLTLADESLPQAKIMESVRSSTVLANAAKSFADRRTGDIYPTHRPDVRARGEGQPSRTITLPVSGLTMKLPDDGYFWLVTEGDGVDVFDRLLPTLPEVSAETLLARQMTCAQMWEAIGTDVLADHRPTGLPPGWEGGPAIKVDGGEIELTACYNAPPGALLFGVFQGPTKTDVSSVSSLMTAILAGAIAPQ